MASVQKRFQVPISFSIAIVLVAGLAVWLLVVIFAAKVSEEVDRPFAVTDLDRKQETSAITSVIGTLTTVSDDSLTLTASPVQNPHLSREAAITVLLTPQTRYSRSSVPLSAPEAAAGDLSALYRFSSATRSDLKAGIKVNVRTGSEVRGKTEVDAESIEILTVTGSQ